MNRFKWPLPEEVYDTALEDIFMPHVPVSYTTGGGKWAQYTLPDGHRDEIVNLERFGRRAFACAGPTLWNKLPRNMRDNGNLAQFKKQ